MTTKPPLRKILQGILHTKDKSKQNHKQTGSIKPQEKKKKQLESSIDLTVHNQTHKEQKN
jgi:hypothetical protein